MCAAPSIKKTPRRLWRWLSRAALSLLVLCVIGAVSLWLRLAWEASQGRKQLAAVVAEIEEKDPRWRFEQMQEDLAPIPERENSMLVVKKVADSLPKWDAIDASSPDGRDAYDSEYPANRRLDDRRLAAIRVALQKREPGLALAVSLKDYPRGRARFQLSEDVFNTLIPHGNDVRTVYRLLELDVERRTHRGQIDPTADHVVAILNAGAGLRDDPFLVSLLVRLAGRSTAAFRVERLLGMGELSDKTCAALQARFAAERPEGEFARSLRGDRSLYDLIFERISQGRLTVAEWMAQSNGNANSKPDLSLRLGGALYASRVHEDHAQLLDWFEEAFAIAQLPDKDQLAEWGALTSRVRQTLTSAAPYRRLILAGMMMPRLEKVAQADLRLRATVSAAETALAAERFRLAHKRWPETLGELCPAFLAAVPLDPFVGEPLCYGKHADGVSIYSVGPDLEDDGGEILRFKKEGNWDVGVRLYDPDQRGLPAAKEGD